MGQGFLCQSKSIYHKVKMRYFLKKNSLFPGKKSQIEYIVMMIEEGATKIVNRMIPGFLL